MNLGLLYRKEIVLAVAFPDRSQCQCKEAMQAIYEATCDMPTDTLFVHRRATVLERHEAAVAEAYRMGLIRLGTALDCRHARDYPVVATKYGSHFADTAEWVYEANGR